MGICRASSEGLYASWWGSVCDCGLMVQNVDHNTLLVKDRETWASKLRKKAETAGALRLALFGQMVKGGGLKRCLFFFGFLS